MPLANEISVFINHNILALPGLIYSIDIYLMIIMPKFHVFIFSLLISAYILGKYLSATISKLVSSKSISLSYCALVNKSIPNHPTVPLRDQKLSLEGTDFQLLIKFPPSKHITMPDLPDNAWLHLIFLSLQPLTHISCTDLLYQCLTHFINAWLYLIFRSIEV